MYNVLLYDSGIGGLSILKEIRKSMPNEKVVYFADNLNVPLGNLPEHKVIDCTMKNFYNFDLCKTKAIVIACNTVSAICKERIRDEFDIPIICIEPEIKTPIIENQLPCIVFGTKITTEHYQKVFNHSEIDFMPLRDLAFTVENNFFDKDLILKELLKIKSFLKKDYSSVVLGCTHYALVKDLFERVFFSSHLYDGVKGTVLELQRKINQNSFSEGGVEFCLSKDEYFERFKFLKIFSTF